MTDNRLAEIKAIQKRIVNALEAREDVSQLRNELARVRAEIAADAEIAELKKITVRRQSLKDKAAKVIATVADQDAAITTFLKARDALLTKLQELQEPLKELAQMGNTSWEANPGKCYLYNDVGAFSAAVIDIPKELLPADFSCHTLEMIQGSERSFGKARQAWQYFEYCIGILSSFKKGSMSVHARSTDDSLLLDNEPETTEANCLVCQHERVAEINEALKSGRPLRELETEFGISRSTLSRHKNRCLNLGAIRIVKAEPESPTASSDQTFFRG